MSSAPPVGSQSGHDWLVVGTVNPPSPEVESALKPNKSLQDWFAALTALLGKFEDRSANFFRTARIVGGGAVFALLNKVRDQSFQNSVAALGRLLPRIGNRVHGGWRWLRARKFGWLRAHPIVAVSALAIILPLAYLTYCIATVPSDGGLVIEPTPSALVVEADGGQVFASRGVFKGDKLSPEDVPLNLSRAIIAIEDRHFYEHTGFYLPSLMRAAYRNFLAGSAREGGSTITQQLARMTYLSQERTIKRKVQEAIITYWIEHQLKAGDTHTLFEYGLFRSWRLWS